MRPTYLHELLQGSLRELYSKFVRNVTINVTFRGACSDEITDSLPNRDDDLQRDNDTNVLTDRHTGFNTKASLLIGQTVPRFVC